MSSCKRDCKKPPDTKRVFAPVSFTGSAFVWLASVFANMILVISPVTWIDRQWRKRNSDRYPMWIAEAWVVLLLAVQMLALWSLCYIPGWVALLVGFYGLADVAVALVKDVVVAPQLHRDTDGAFVQIRDPLRWVLFAVTQIAEVVICFAVLMRHWGVAFEPKISTATLALYQSFLTFTTLGFGDIKPADSLGHWLVVAELVFFLAFLALKLPVAISVMRVRQAAR